MKVKARDLVKGWPRGGSTSRIRWWKFQLDPFAQLLKGPCEERMREGLENVRYHRAQQEMLDAYFERQRLPQPKPIRIATS